MLAFKQVRIFSKRKITLTDLHGRGSYSKRLLRPPLVTNMLWVGRDQFLSLRREADKQFQTLIHDNRVPKLGLRFVCPFKPMGLGPIFFKCKTVGLKVYTLQSNSYYHYNIIFLITLKDGNATLRKKPFEVQQKNKRKKETF